MLAVAQPANEPVLPAMPVAMDLFGQILFAHYQGNPGDFYLRRDDNNLERDTSGHYFRTREQMPAHQRCLLHHARGRVLDIGAGSGQHARLLQERGLDVTAIDVSPLAVEVCRAGGVRDARVMDATQLSFADGEFDTVLLMSNNMGIAGTPGGLRSLLTQLHAIVRPGGQILADITDYTATHNPLHLRYHQRNIAHGRYPGSIRLRLEYDGVCSPQFDWLLMKLADLKVILADTGWRIQRCVQVADGSQYAIGFARE